LAIGLLIGIQASTPRALAIPAFARKYRTACSTCHTNWPELNDFGLAFKQNGFKFPKDDDTFVKDPPLLLGAAAQKESFPHSIYPGELPILPIAFRYSGFFTVNSSQSPTVAAAVGNIPRTDLFQPNTFTIIAAGSFGPSISFWIDNDISTGGLGSAGGLGDGYLKANDFLGHYLKVSRNDLNTRFGQFELDLPFTQARTINLSAYAIYTQAAFANPTGMGPVPGTTANPFVFSSPQRAIEFGGYPNNGNTMWSVAIVNGNNSSPAVRSSKDVYASFGQRFKLERDPAVRKEIQVSGPTGVRDHTSIRFNGFGYYGTNELNQDGVLYPGLPALHEPFYRAGGAFLYKFRSKFELWGLYEHGHDANRVIDESGTSFVRTTPVTFSGGFLEAEYFFYPWLIGLMRYDGVNSPTDRLNGFSRYDTRNIYTPGAQALVRPNIKLAVEYSYTYDRPVPGTIFFYRPSTFVTNMDFIF
jgi:hypothetical protein